MAARSSPVYEEIIPKIKEFKAKNPNAKNSAIYKALGISHFVFYQAMKKIEGALPTKVKRQSNNYKKLVVPSMRVPDLLPEQPRLTVFVIKGDVLTVSKMIAAIH